jgi:hypothetical protein
MNLTQWQTKPSWGEYEAELLRQGFEPYWDPETEQRIGTVAWHSSHGFLGLTRLCGAWHSRVNPILCTGSEPGRENH